MNTYATVVPAIGSPDGRPAFAALNEVDRMVSTSRALAAERLVDAVGLLARVARRALVRVGALRLPRRAAAARVGPGPYPAQWSALERHLSHATDRADLERRMREWERRPQLRG
jgi:hypothetical protein